MTLPTATHAQIVGALRHPAPGSCFAKDYPYSHRMRPEEIWLPALGCWVYAEGRRVMFDQGRGEVKFSRWQAWRIRRAIAAFRRTPNGA